MPKNKKAVPNNQQLLHSSVSYHGPIPPSKEMLGYEHACPGAADRIISMAEQQGEHRRNLEKYAVTADISINRVGQIFAFAIILTLIIGSFVLLILGRNTSGFVTLGCTIVSGISVYIYGKNKQDPKKRELNN